MRRTGAVITKVACTNPKCANYGRRKSVASAMLIGYDPKVCPICRERMKVVEQINASGNALAPAANLAETVVRN